MPIATIKCPSCNTRVNVSVNNSMSEEGRYPAHCPRCKQDFEFGWHDIPARVKDILDEFTEQDGIEDIDEKRFNEFVVNEPEDVIDEAITKVDEEFEAASTSFADSSAYEIKQIDSEHIVSDERLRELSEAFSSSINEKLRDSGHMPNRAAGIIEDLIGQTTEQVAQSTRDHIEEDERMSRAASRFSRFF